MDDLDKKTIKGFLKSRHSLLVNGILYLAASIFAPAYTSYLSNVSIETTIQTASKWIRLEYSDCTIFSRELMIVTSGLQSGVLLFAFGVTFLFNYMYTEFKYRSVFRHLKQMQEISTDINRNIDPSNAPWFQKASRIPKGNKMKIKPATPAALATIEKKRRIMNIPAQVKDGIRKKVMTNSTKDHF